MAERVSLEDRIRFYETREHDPALERLDWLFLGLSGLLFPLGCLVLGWWVGW
jgi:hypothetical protein